MKKIILLLLTIFLMQVSTKAQLIKPAQAPSPFTENLGKVIQSFRNNYYQVQGELLSSVEDVDTYRCSVSIPGSKRSVIYRFHSREDTTAGWQASMYSGDNYNAAVKSYKETCRLVSKGKFNIQGNAAAGFSGKTEMPEGTLRFVSSAYKLTTKDPAYKHFYAEVELVNLTFDQWEVHLNLQNKKVDDEDEEEGE